MLLQPAQRRGYNNLIELEYPAARGYIHFLAPRVVCRLAEYLRCFGPIDDLGSQHGGLGNLLKDLLVMSLRRIGSLRRRSVRDSAAAFGMSSNVPPSKHSSSQKYFKLCLSIGLPTNAPQSRDICSTIRRFRSDPSAVSGICSTTFLWKKSRRLSLESISWQCLFEYSNASLMISHIVSEYASLSSDGRSWPSSSNVHASLSHWPTLVPVSSPAPSSGCRRSHGSSSVPGRPSGRWEVSPDAFDHQAGLVLLI